MMRLGKKLLAYVLVFTMVLSLIPMDVRAEGTEITWSVEAAEETVLVAEGEQATLEVIVENPDGVALTYEWYQIIDDVGNAEAIIEATSTSYVVGSVTECSEYYCMVEGPNEVAMPVWFYVSVDSGLTAAAVENDYTEVYAENVAEVKVSYGEAATLQVAASVNDGEEEPTYQWYEMVDMGEGIGLQKEAVAGATGSSYAIDAITERTEYCCVVTDAYGYSKEVSFCISIDTGLTVEAVGDTNITVAAGETVELEVKASVDDGSAVTYQWYVWDYNEGRQDVSDATGAIYTIANVTEAGQYGCEVTDIYGNSASVDFYIEIDAGWTAEAEKGYITVDKGTSATLKVVVDSEDDHTFTYQWYKRNLEDADEKLDCDTESYTTEALNGHAEYYCVVTDENGNEEEVWFDVYVNVEWTAMAADGQGEINVGVGSPAALEVVIDAGENYEFTYQWYQAYDGFAEPLDGAESGSYTTGEITKYSRYFCEVIDEYGNTQEVHFDIYPGPAWSVSAKDGEDKAVELNSTATLEVEVASEEEVFLTYQWYQLVDGYESGLIEGATQSSYTTGVVSERAVYYCEVSDDYGKVKTVGFNVIVNANWDAEAVGETDISIARYDITTMEVVVNNEEGIPLTYQWWKSDEANGAMNQVEGADGMSYTTEGITVDTTYLCVITDAYGNQFFVEFNLTVDEEKQHTHVYDEYEVTKEATCNEAGTEVGICAGCREEDTKTLPATGKHTYGEYKETKAATCTVAGSKARTCTVCKKEETEVVPATGKHTYGEWVVTKKATYNKAGEQERICTVCKNKETSAIPAIGYVKGVTFTKDKYVYKITARSGKKGSVTCVGTTKKLKSVSVPKTVKAGGITFKVTAIADKAFKGNTKLKSVTIGANVTKIGKEAFSGCKKLNKITIKSTKLKSVGKNAIKGINKKATIKVPKSKLKKYKKLFKTKTGYKKTMKIKK